MDSTTRRPVFGFVMAPRDVRRVRTTSNGIITLVIAAIIPAPGVRIVCLLLLFFFLLLSFLHPDPEQPFLKRGGEDGGSNLETILIMRLSTHVTVPCLVTVPDLNVTLQTVGASPVTQPEAVKWGTHD